MAVVEPGRPHQDQVPHGGGNLDPIPSLPVGADAKAAVAGDDDDGNEAGILDVVPVRGNAQTSRLIALQDDVIQAQRHPCSMPSPLGQGFVQSPFDHRRQSLERTVVGKVEADFELLAHFVFTLADDGTRHSTRQRLGLAFEDFRRLVIKPWNGGGTLGLDDGQCRVKFLPPGVILAAEGM